ncbi:hypothetical protein FKM82_023679 [Ascaphus truei]
MVKSAVVIDLGTGYTKSGFSPEDRPYCIIPSRVDMPWSELPSESMSDAGDDIPHDNGVVSRHPVIHGVVVDWDAVELLWEHILYKCLRTDPTLMPLLLLDSPNAPAANRELAAELLFEGFGVPRMHVTHSSVLALYSCGRITGLVLDLGDGASFICPIEEGYILPHALYWTDIAGSALTRYLGQLRDHSQEHITSELEKYYLGDLKENACYVSLNYGSDLDEHHEMKDYELPDGKKISMGTERFQCPELLFQPNLLGIDELGIHILAIKSLIKVGECSSNELFRSVLLCGGSSLFPGLAERLQKELDALLPLGSAFNLIVPKSTNRRQYASWVGGSLTASLDAFQKLWISKDEYKEEGAAILHKKCT